MAAKHIQPASTSQREWNEQEPKVEKKNPEEIEKYKKTIGTIQASKIPFSCAVSSF